MLSSLPTFKNRDAIINEALRIHPNTGLILERLVPAEGAVIDGYTLPGGTIVGVNAWVIHFNKDIYGEDVHVFRPERWLEASQEKAAEMKRNLFSVWTARFHHTALFFKNLPFTNDPISTTVWRRAPRLHWPQHRHGSNQQSRHGILPPFRRRARAAGEGVEGPWELGHEADGDGHAGHATFERKMRIVYFR